MFNGEVRMKMYNPYHIMVSSTAVVVADTSD